MKTRLVCTVIAALLVTGYLFAGDPRVTINIPFAFQAGKTALPAGEYDIDKIMPHVVRVVSTDGSLACLIVSNAVANPTGPPETKLVFNRYGEKYFLSQVWLADNYGHEFRPSRAERETARAAAAPPTKTLLLARSK